MPKVSKPALKDRKIQQGQQAETPDGSWQGAGGNLLRSHTKLPGL